MKFPELENLERRERHKMARTLAMAAALVVVLIVLGGCQHAGPAADTLASGYCAATDEQDQNAMRERMDAETAPHEVRILCESQGTEGVPE